MSSEDYLPNELADLAASLDIPPHKYAEAVRHYKAVAEWLATDGSETGALAPDIYVQGSFRLGTVIRPLRDGMETDHDIDLVCSLTRPLADSSARVLKNCVGDRLKANETYRRKLDREGRRCWTLQYAEKDGAGFHLDVLPAIPAARLSVLELSARSDDPSFASHAIEITEFEKEREAYSWVEGGSNPRGYAEWFDQLNERAAGRVSVDQKRLLFESNRGLYGGIDEVPSALVRSPLQRAIQLMKRHRDARFTGHELEKEKPISIIITTLAAKAYDDEGDPWAALMRISERIEENVGFGLIERLEGKWWIRNPVNHDENLADRWNDQGSKRKDAFFEWISWLRRDLSDAAEFELSGDRQEVLNESFGATPGRARAIGLGDGSSLVPALADATHRLRPANEFPMRIDTDITLTVKASVHKRQFGDKSSRLRRSWVRRNRWIRFTAETNASEPFEVRWQVVNTGDEAAKAGRLELRGGFEPCNGVSEHERWERTEYRGTHWVEAFILSGGVCVARSGRIYVKIR